MNVLVDTSVWSLALRRSPDNPHPLVDELKSLIDGMRVEIIGPIRQEILSGIRETEQFVTLRETMGAFPDREILREDYERAAEMYNICRREGVQGSNTDFLICAVAERLGLAILTTDHDFLRYQELLPITLYRQD